MTQTGNFLGAKHWVGFKPQAVAGTAETTVTTFLVTEGLDMNPNPKPTPRKSFAGTGVNLPARVGTYAPSGKCPAEVHASTPHPWYWALGHVVSSQPAVSTDPTVYLHTITDDALAVSQQNNGGPVNLTAEGNRVFGYSKQGDVAINSIKLSVTPGEVGKLEVEWFALTQAESGSTTSTPTFVTDVLTCRSVSVKLDGSADQTVTSADVEWKANLEQLPSLDGAGTGAPHIIRKGQAPDITGSLKWIDHPTAQAAKFLAATTFALVIELDGDTISNTYKKFLRLTLPACQYDGGLTPSLTEKVITGDANFTAYYDTATSTQIKVEAQNTVATINS